MPIGIEHVDVLASAAGDDLTVKDADAERLLRCSRRRPPHARTAPATSRRPSSGLRSRRSSRASTPPTWWPRWDAQAAPAARRARARPAASLLPAALRRAVAGGRRIRTTRRCWSSISTATWVELAEIFDLSSHWLLADEPRRRTRLPGSSGRACCSPTSRFAGSSPTRSRGPRPTSYLLPLDNPQRMFNDATELRRARPGTRPARCGGRPGQRQPPSRSCRATTPWSRQFEDVRRGRGPTDRDRPHHHRLCAHRRARRGRAPARRVAHRGGDPAAAPAHERSAREPILGAYGWVDALSPSDDPTPPTRAGLVHAPSYTQALTAAVLRDHVVHDDTDTRWQMTLSSTTVRAAAELADQVRTGIPLGEVLGREIERRFPEPNVVLELRKQFPARPEWSGPPGLRRPGGARRGHDPAEWWLPPTDARRPARRRSTRTPICSSPTRCTTLSPVAPMPPRRRSRPPPVSVRHRSCGCCARRVRAARSAPTWPS